MLKRSRSHHTPTFSPKSERGKLDRPINKEAGLTLKMLQDFVEDLMKPRPLLGNCPECKEVVAAIPHAYLLYLDRYYHADCLGRKLYRELG